MNLYSQNNEQTYILEAFAEKSDGRFLDIGAYDAKLLSNTRALYERGWSGVMVEPSPGPMKQLLAEYGNDPRITLVMAPVTKTCEMVKIYGTDDAISTSSETALKIWKDGGYEFYGSFLTQSITLDLLVYRFGVAWDFVNIDVEGGSADLFLACLRFPLRPKVYCVEHDHRHGELVSIAAKAGYREVLRNGENCIFVKGEA